VRGKVAVAGSKYSALAAIPAALLAEQPTHIGNAPDIRDTRDYCALLGQMGARVQRQGCAILIDPRDAAFTPVSPEWAEGLRASYYMVGAQLGRWGRAEVGLPGGDRIGRRPIDLHVKVLRAMGAEVELDIPGRVIRARRTDRLQGASIYLDTPSVGATAQAMICGVLARGETRIENAYVAAFIVDLAELLNAMGADVRGAGTQLIRIRGVQALHGAKHALIGDQAEAFTYLAAAAASGGEVRVEGIEPAQLGSGLAKLSDAGAETCSGPGYVQVRGPARLRATDVTTGPLPSFYTDYQPPMAAALATAEGVSRVAETVWPERFGYAEGLQAMGAQVRRGSGSITIGGVRQLKGQRVVAAESRAAAAYVVAGICAEGVTRITGTEHLERVYSDLPGKLRALGVDIVEAPADGDAAAEAGGPEAPRVSVSLSLSTRLVAPMDDGRAAVAEADDLPLAAASAGAGEVARPRNGHGLLPAGDFGRNDPALAPKAQPFGVLPAEDEDGGD